MARPIPSNHAEAIARSGLIDVDISGGASTVANDELTTGHESTGKAIRGGFTADSRFPAGRANAPTLLEAYQAYLRRTALAKEGATGTPEEVEAQALKKSRRRLKRHLQEGLGSPQAVAKAFQHYRKRGGRSGFAVWSKTVHK